MDSVAFALAFVLLAVAGLALAFAVAERRRMRADGRALGQLVSLDVALVASFAAIFVLTLFPIEDATDIQLVPLGDITDALTPPVEAERYLRDGKRPALRAPRRRLGLRGLRLGAAAALGLALSAGVELTQLLLVSGRTTSVDDLLLNTLGRRAGIRLAGPLTARPPCVRAYVISGIPITRRNVRNGTLTALSALRPPNARLLARNVLALRSREPWRGQVARSRAGLEPLAEAGLRWICRSQDEVGSGGVGDYTFHGWTPGYPEVTGYIIPTLWDYHHLLGRDELAQRAIRMAEWELRIQKSEGGFESLYEGEGREPVVFNTAQVIRGLTRTYLETREQRYLDAAVRAGDWIVANQEPDGSWTKANYLGMKRTYDAYAAAGLAQLATATSDERYANAASANGEFVLRHQHDNGWFELCDNTPEGNATPSTHTLCYTVDGLLEMGAALGERSFTAAAERAAAPLMEAVDTSGRLPGRFDADWRPASSYVVVTGSAQLGVILMKLYAETAMSRRLETAQEAPRLPRVRSGAERRRTRTARAACRARSRSGGVTSRSSTLPGPRSSTSTIFG